MGKPLEDVVNSPRYVDVMLRGRKVKRTVGAVGRVPGRAVGKVLHVAHVPRRGVDRRAEPPADQASQGRRAKAKDGKGGGDAR